MLPRQFERLVDGEPLIPRNLQPLGHVQDHCAIILLNALGLAPGLLGRQAEFSGIRELLRDAEALIGEFASVQSRERVAYAETRVARRGLLPRAGLRRPLGRSIK